MERAETGSRNVARRQGPLRMRSLCGRARLPMFLCILSLATAAQLSAQHAAATRDSASAVRTRYTIDDNWKFVLGGLNFAWSPSVGDAAWKTVAIPHTWNAHDPFDDVPSYRRGIGWYRKEL